MADTFDYIFVGLGNPGTKYQRTRHNIGWLALYEFVLRNEKDFNFSNSLNAYQVKLQKSGKSILCLLPATYMNNSGEAILAAIKKYKVPTQNIIVLVDEYNFALGRIQLNIGGSAGGHNGLKSILFHLDTDKFYKLRMGISKNFGPGELVDYVLSEFTEEEWNGELTKAIIKTVKSLEKITQIGPAKAMNEINSDRL
jgi:PTH1 family peptidyl-tRNA hydrolase